MRLAVGEEHQHPIGRIGRGAEQLGALGENRRETGSPLAGEIGIERVEIHPDGAAIHRERREDVAPSGEGDQPEPVAFEILDQAARLAGGALQAGWAPRPRPASSG